jgi:hypothetical protein
MHDGWFKHPAEYTRENLGAAFVAPFATGGMMNQSFRFFFSVSDRPNPRIAKSTEVCGNPSCAKTQGWGTRKSQEMREARIGSECLDEFALLQAGQGSFDSRLVGCASARSLRMTMDTKG